jgi:hypothetical protein
VADVGNFSTGHDIFYPGIGTTQSVAVSSAGATSTTVFTTQTRAIRVVAMGTAVNSNSWVFMKLGTALEAPVASSLADVPIPINLPEIFKCYPSQKASFITTDATTSYRVYVSELSD